LASCSGQMMTTVDSNVAPKAGKDAGLAGIPYYLPTSIIPITISAAPAGSATDKSPTSSPPGGASGAGGAATTITASPQVTVSVQTGAPPPKTSKADAPNYTLSAAIGAPSYVPDAGQEHFLQYDLDSESDNQFTLSVDQNNLLTSVQGQSTDQRGAALVALAQLGTTLAGAVTGGAASPVNARFELLQSSAPSKEPTTCNVSAFTWTVNYQPGGGSFADITPDANQEIFKIDTRNDIRSERAGNAWVVARFPDKDTTGQTKDEVIRVAITAKGPTTQPDMPAQYTPPTNPPYWSGVLLRKKVLWKFTLKLMPDDNVKQFCHLQETERSFALLLPNNAPAFVEDMSRAPLVQKSINLTVANGMLQSVAVTRPSTLLAAVKLPLTIVQTVIGSTVGAATTPLTSGSSPGSNPAGGTATGTPGSVSPAATPSPSTGTAGGASPGAATGGGSSSSSSASSSSSSSSTP
jgi:hypothetical protein